MLMLNVQIVKQKSILIQLSYAFFNSYSIYTVRMNNDMLSKLANTDKRSKKIKQESDEGNFYPTGGVTHIDRGTRVELDSVGKFIALLHLHVYSNHLREYFMNRDPSEAKATW